MEEISLRDEWYFNDIAGDIFLFVYYSAQLHLNSFYILR